MVINVHRHCPDGIRETLLNNGQIGIVAASTSQDINACRLRLDRDDSVPALQEPLCLGSSMSADVKDEFAWEYSARDFVHILISQKLNIFPRDK